MGSDVVLLAIRQTLGRSVTFTVLDPMNLKLVVTWSVVLGLITCVFGLPSKLKAAQSGKERKAQCFSDSFDVDHDFLSQGVADRGWDGFLGKGPRETADRIAVADGKLYLQSTRGRYQEGWNPLGPLLYKTVTGDFKATVRVVDYEKLSYNNCSIMARAANQGDAGTGEDWISVDDISIEYKQLLCRNLLGDRLCDVEPPSAPDDGRKQIRGSDGTHLPEQHAQFAIGRRRPALLHQPAYDWRTRAMALARP